MVLLPLLFACTGKGSPAQTDTTDTADSGLDSGDTAETGDTADSGADTAVDADGDGWPADQDCDDADPNVNPGVVDKCDGRDEDCDGAIDNDALDGLTLITADTTAGFVYAIDPATAAVTAWAPLASTPNVPSIAVSPDGISYFQHEGTLYTLDPHTGEEKAVGLTGLGRTCGLQFDGDGVLWGLDKDSDSLVTIDTTTGLGTVVGSLGFDLVSCGMAWDCTKDRLIGAEDGTDSLFEIDRTTGLAENFVTTTIPFDSVGLEYDPTTQTFLASTSTELYRVDDNTGETTDIGTMAVMNADDLEFVP